MTDDETIVAVYDTPAHAAAAVASLQAAGIPPAAIDVHAGSATHGPGAARAPGFWSTLFGGEPAHDTSIYEMSIEAGSTVVTVKTLETNVTDVVTILESHGPIDLDDRAADYGFVPAPAAPSPVPAPEPEVIPLTPERPGAGQRMVNLGNARIRRYVAGTPAGQDAPLARPLVGGDHPITDAEFTDGEGTAGPVPPLPKV